jgi:long-chain acyl-CoA synthetase
MIKYLQRSRTKLKKDVVLLAIELGLVYEPYGANGLWYEMQLKIARKLILANGKRDWAVTWI